MIVSVLSQNPELSIPEVAELIGKSESATERAIRKLRGEGKIRRAGPAKGGHWEVMTDE
jgi:ATP-dependent DNA helicase RecG